MRTSAALSATWRSSTSSRTLVTPISRRPWMPVGASTAGQLLAGRDRPARRRRRRRRPGSGGWADQHPVRPQRRRGASRVRGHPVRPGRGPRAGVAGFCLRTTGPGARFDGREAGSGQRRVCPGLGRSAVGRQAAAPRQAPAASSNGQATTVLSQRPVCFRLCRGRPARWAGNPATGRACRLTTQGRWDQSGKCRRTSRSTCSSGAVFST